MNLNYDSFTLILDEVKSNLFIAFTCKHYKSSIKKKSMLYWRGGPSVNKNKFFNKYITDILENMNGNCVYGISKTYKNRHHSLEYRNWRRTVFIRDEFTCQKCGKKHIYLEAHHIKPFILYPKLRLNINNGITFCKNCHLKKFHKIYGFKNNNQKQLNEFLTEGKILINRRRK